MIRVPGVSSARGRAIVSTLHSAIGAIDTLPPSEQDLIIGALVADLRARRPVAVAPLGVLGPPTDPSAICDPRRAG